MPELARIDQLLEAAALGHVGALVIEGEAGTGKTRLLRAAALRAEGFTRISVVGVESETALAHACLLELLRPLRRHIQDVPAGQAGALAAALGWSSVSSPGDRYLVAAGTLSMLAAAAEAAPLLVLVDDAQWIDTESLEALLFATRRMHQDRVTFLIAQRPSPRDIKGVPALTLADLAGAEAEVLLTPHLAGSVVRELFARLGGNPLALLEVAAHLSADQRRGTAPLPEALPVGPDLAGVFEQRLTALSPDARQALLLLAAAHHGRISHVAAALRLSGGSAEVALDELEERRLVVRTGDVLTFWHPLIRSQVWTLATPQQRRAAHRALAETARAGDVSTRTWHRAQSASGPDDNLAGDMVAMAARARTQRGFSASSAALEWAASLTTDAGRSATRLAAAVTDALVSGDVERTRALASQVLHGEATSPARAEALHALGILEQNTGSVLRARDLLREAADLGAGSMRTWSLAELAITQHRLGEVSGMIKTAEQIAEEPDDFGPEQQALVAWVVGAARIQAGDPETGRPHVRQALEVMESEPSLRDEPRFLLYMMLGLSWLDEGLEVVPWVERRLRVARERGALGVLVPALAMSAYGRAQFLGDHAGAFADAGEAVELAEQLGYVADAAPAVELLAWEYAARGLPDEAGRLLEKAKGLVARAGTADVAAHLALTAAFCALCRGDLDETVRLLEARIAADGGVGSLGEPLGVAPLLVEAYASLGRMTEAAAFAEQYAEVSRSPTPPTAALVARCRALACANDDMAVAAFEESLTFDALAPDRFEAAHTRLLFGARLRRSGRRTQARGQLRAAAGEFAAMDLLWWAQRADTELRATGQVARPRRPLVEEPLTSQETRVAVFAAQGLLNREIAAALFLSPKTVEHHLSSVYRKRGLRSRVQLAHTFLPASDGPRAPHPAD